MKTDLETNTTTKITNGDTIITNRSLYDAQVKGLTHTLGAGINLKPDTVTTINATANYILATERTNSTNNQNGENNFWVC
ncbi:hypothetical protein LWM68_40180 [Niabella sp. W65]|nr:hypothetical protein [Niabella sp. W65]MCH7368412.1 hypothetical protein [Niabella sp. W65]ULT44012.1 hypothetical protein KRR40_11890 [Niabella sp. I65]